MICRLHISFKQRFYGHSISVNLFALFPEVIIIQRQGNDREQKTLLWLPTSANVRRSIG